MTCAIQRALAQQDIGDAFDHYLSVASAATATDFILAFDACVHRIEHYPRADSLYYAELLDVDGLRFAVVNRYPYLGHPLAAKFQPLPAGATVIP